MKRVYLLALGLLSGSAAFADGAKGLEIAQKIDAANSGWGDEQVSTTMTLRAADGREVIRQIRNRSIEVEGEGDKSLVIFDKPGDVKGTVFLTHTHKAGNDDQWLFLPAVKRVKRISSSNRAGPFMGSEFAYEDISSEEVERYEYNYLREDQCGGGQDCHVFERYPVDENSGYTKQVVYADKAFYRIHRIEYFDRKGDHIKTLTRTNYAKTNGFWRASHWEMVNHLKKKTSLVVWSNRRFGTGLTEQDFNKNALMRFK